jgi:hypothetical protein
MQSEFVTKVIQVTPGSSQMRLVADIATAWFISCPWDLARL